MKQSKPRWFAGLLRHVPCHKAHQLKIGQKWEACSPRICTQKHLSSKVLWAFTIIRQQEVGQINQSTQNNRYGGRVCIYIINMLMTYACWYVQRERMRKVFCHQNISKHEKSPERTSISSENYSGLGCICIVYVSWNIYKYKYIYMYTEIYIYVTRTLKTSKIISFEKTWIFWHSSLDFPIVWPG